MQVNMIPIDQVFPDPNNPRQSFSEGDVAELAASIEVFGIKVPLIGYRSNSKVLLADGHRRLTAAKSVNVKEVPIIVFPESLSEADLLATQLTINGHRQSLNPMEEFEAFSRLAKLKDWSASDLAKGLAVSNAQVTRVMSLGNLTEAERALVREGKISKSSAYALSRVPAEERSALAAKAAAGELTRDELNTRARKKKSKPDKKSHRVTCEAAGGTVSIRSDLGLNLEGLVELLEELLRHCRKARSQGLDISTAIRVMRDRARIQTADSAGA